jgi:hypothetical protein
MIDSLILKSIIKMTTKIKIKDKLSSTLYFST